MLPAQAIPSPSPTPGRRATGSNAAKCPSFFLPGNHRQKYGDSCNGAGSQGGIILFQWAALSTATTPARHSSPLPAEARAAPGERRLGSRGTLPSHGRGTLQYTHTHTQSLNTDPIPLPPPALTRLGLAADDHTNPAAKVLYTRPPTLQS